MTDRKNVLKHVNRIIAGLCVVLSVLLISYGILLLVSIQNQYPIVKRAVGLILVGLCILIWSWLAGGVVLKYVGGDS